MKGIVTYGYPDSNPKPPGPKPTIYHELNERYPKKTRKTSIYGIYFATFSVYFIDIYAESWSFRPEKLPATFGSGLASSTSLCRRRVPRILGAKAEGETSSSALVIWGFLWVVSLNGGWNPPPFHKPQVFWSFLVTENGSMGQLGISPTILGSPHIGDEGFSSSPCSISFFFLTHEVPEPERKSGWQKWLLMSFFEGPVGGSLQPPLILKKKHPSWCFVWFEEPIAGFCWAVHQSRSCRETLKLAVRQNIGFFSTCESVNWSWGLGRDAVSFQATGHVGHVRVTY